MKPLIALTQRLVEVPGRERRECLASEWGDFFASNLAGFLPLPLAYALPFSHYAPLVCGVILSGGNDLARFSQESCSQIRDSYERQIISSCHKDGIPLFGICRGAQIIAEYFGGELAAGSGHVGRHSISCDGKEYEVNSYHNFCVTSVASPLTVRALAGDGSIEAFACEGADIFATMWHIERAGGMSYEGLWREFLGAVTRRRASLEQKEQNL